MRVPASKPNTGFHPRHHPCLFVKLLLWHGATWLAPQKIDGFTQNTDQSYQWIFGFLVLRHCASFALMKARQHSKANYIYTQHLYVYVYCYAGQIHIFHSPHLPGRGRAPHQWPEPGGEGSFQTISEGGSTDQPHPYFLSFPGWFWWSQEGFIFRHSQERVWSQIRKYEPPWKP